VGIEGVKTVREAIGDFPLVAIGGITTKNVSEVLRAGANSAAVISDLLGNAAKISDKMRKFITD
jgi:thiamine-phosphate pyrophosphorylase